MNFKKIEIISGEEVKSIDKSELGKMVHLWTEEMYEDPEGLSMQVVEDLRKQYRKMLFEHLEEAANVGGLVLAKSGDDVVGMIRIVKLKNPGKNDFVEGEVYEIGKAFVIPVAREFIEN